MYEKTIILCAFGGAKVRTFTDITKIIQRKAGNLKQTTKDYAESFGNIK